MKKKTIFIMLLVFILALTGCQKKEYNVAFVDWNDVVLLETSLPKGSIINPPAEPSREGYKFIAWDQEFSVAEKDITIKALYEKLTYVVKFFSYNGELLKEETVVYNGSATAPIVAKEDELEFSHWDISFNNVKSDLNVQAIAKEIIYTVKFFGYNGELLKEEKVLLGKGATAPVVASYGEEEFSHWDTSFNNVKSNLNVQAIFKEKEYSLTFYDGTTKLSFDVNSYKNSDDFLLPLPTKDGYIFSGWFLSDISLYEVKNINPLLKGNLKLYSRWVKTEKNNFVAPNHVGEFVQINRNLHSNGVSYVYQPQFPQGASTSVTAYDWASSNTKVATISAYSSISIASPGYTIITGTLKTDSSVVYYCVIETSADGIKKISLEEANAPSYVRAIFKMSDTETITKTVSKGGFATPPTAPAKEGYIFTGWVGENNENTYNITKDTVFLPTYTLGATSYAGKTISVLGDSITTYNGYIPEDFAYFYPYPTADLADVNQTWWMQFINHYGMNLLVNNAWSGSAVAGDANSAARNISRLKYLYIDEVKPDVILIFMGANDAPSPYITLNQFDAAYNEMITNIKLVSPHSEIILCTLPSLPLYTQSDQDSYNEVIRKYANLNGFALIDFSNVFTRSESSVYLVDSAHPNKDGMNKLAEKAIADFLLEIK